MKHRVLYYLIACILIAPVSIARQETLEKPVYWIHWEYILSPKDIPSKLSNLFKKHGYKLCPRPKPAAIKKDAVVVFQDIDKRLINSMKINRLPLKNRILLLVEPSTIVLTNANYMYWQQFFGKVLTWDDTLVDNKKYFKIYVFAMTRAELQSLPQRNAFVNRKLCTLVARNHRKPPYPGELPCVWPPNELYTERLKVIKFFETLTTDDFEFYGYWWENLGYKNYRGTIDNKIETLTKYKFCICYENTKETYGYISEKIFDCFRAGCVPVYWGATNVQDYIPPECFIDRRNFTTTEELYHYLKQMTEEEWNAYLDHAYNYLAYDPRPQLFTIENYWETIISVIKHE